MKTSTVLGHCVRGAALVPIVATMALSSAASADVPPSERIYSRAQTWTCQGLGVFQALYSPWGNDPHVKWLSPDGSRADAVQITVISAEITLVLEGQTYSFAGPTNPPRREGQIRTVCHVYGESGADSISGTAVVGILPKAA